MQLMRSMLNNKKVRAQIANKSKNKYLKEKNNLANLLKKKNNLVNHLKKKNN